MYCIDIWEVNYDQALSSCHYQCATKLFLPVCDKTLSSGVQQSSFFQCVTNSFFRRSTKLFLPVCDKALSSSLTKFSLPMCDKFCLPAPPW